MGWQAPAVVRAVIDKLKPNSERRRRNVAIAMGLDAIGTETGTTPGLSVPQLKILRVLMHGEPSVSGAMWENWAMEWPNLTTVILPTLKQRGLIKETVEHTPAPDLRWDKQPRKLAPIAHQDIAITEIGMLVLYRYERRLVSNRAKYGFSPFK